MVGSGPGPSRPEAETNDYRNKDLLIGLELHVDGNCIGRRWSWEQWIQNLLGTCTTIAHWGSERPRTQNCKTELGDSCWAGQGLLGPELRGMAFVTTSPWGCRQEFLSGSLLSQGPASHLGLLHSERELWDPKTALQFVSLSFGSVGEIIHCLDSKAMVPSPQSFLLPTKTATK